MGHGSAEACPSSTVQGGDGVAAASPSCNAQGGDVAAADGPTSSVQGVSAPIPTQASQVNDNEWAIL